MFSRKEQLIRKTGPDGIGRYDFLKQLINEYTTTKSFECRKQTLANLANFAYDPVNYEFFKQLHIVDLFLAQLSEDSEDLLNFAIAGICNLCCDPEFQNYIITLNGIRLISNHLNHKNKEVVLNSMTVLYFLIGSSTPSVADETVIKRISRFQNNQDKRLQNMSLACLEKLQQ